MAKKIYKPNPQPLYQKDAGKPQPKYAAAEEYDDEYDAEYDEIEEHNRKASKKARRGCLIVFAVFLLVIAIAGMLVFSAYKKETGGENATAITPVTLEIASGSTNSIIAKQLEENGLIGSSDVFKFYIRFIAKDKVDFKAGKFILNPGMSYDEIIGVLSPNLSGNTARETVKIQILEGKSVMHIASLFEEAGLCTAEQFMEEADNLEAFNDIPFVQHILEDIDPNVFHKSEGYLFPDTYDFFKDDTVHNMVRKMYTEMDSKITPEMYAKMKELNISLRKTITLASLIQAEAGHVDQQAKVSGVFWNRLSSKWERGTMGSDVTLRYIKIWMQWNLPEYAEKTYREISYDEARKAVGDDLFYAYVTDDSDTNAKAGLPAGPICSVSESAIQAALNPEKHNYFYFLTDFYENYYYAETYEEHQKNVKTMNQKNEEFAKEQKNSEAKTS